jgi:hypothetical protein
MVAHEFCDGYFFHLEFPAWWKTLSFVSILSASRGKYVAGRRALKAGVKTP